MFDDLPEFIANRINGLIDDLDTQQGEIEGDIETIYETLGAKADDTDFVGATTSSAGQHGLVPAPAKKDTREKLESTFLTSYGTWNKLGLHYYTDDSGKTAIDIMSGTRICDRYPFPEAAAGHNGLMSRSDKTKLDLLPNDAEANVQSDWSITNASSDAFIKNMPYYLRSTIEGYVDRTATEFSATWLISKSLSTIVPQAGKIYSVAGEIHTAGDPPHAFPVDGAGDYCLKRFKWNGSEYEIEGEANVQSDWNQADATADDYIKSKPAIKGGTGFGSVIEGDTTYNTASGYASHAEGTHTTASGDLSHAEGYNTTASNSYAHAEGEGTTASGGASHAEGFITSATAASAHAEGTYTTASGEQSHAGGYHTIASGNSQTVIGKYNVADQDKAFIIGNGTDDSNRSNAFAVDWNGDITGSAFEGVTSALDSLDDKVLNTYITKSANGSIASFSDGADSIPMKSLVTNIVPKQSGTGTPSPDNVRPISGWDSVEVWDDPKYAGLIDWNQLCNPGYPVSQTVNGITFTNNQDGSITANGTATADAYETTSFSLLDGRQLGHVYYIGGCPNGGSASTYWFGGRYLMNDAIQHDFGNGRIAKDLSGAQYSSSFTICIQSGTTVNNLVFKPQIVDLTQMFGSAIADYIYELEQVTAGAGVAWFKNLFPKDYYEYNAGEETCVSAVNGDAYIHNTADLGRTAYGGTLDVVSGVLTAYPFYPSYNGETLNGRWICDRAVYAEGTTPPTGSQVALISGTGTTYTLTPTEVKTLLGENNVWADAGSVEVVYRADPTLAYQELANAVIALGGNV